MAIMKKHPFLQIHYTTSVKFTPSELKSLKRWLSVASKAMEKLLEQEAIIHPSWRESAQHWEVSLLICGDAKIRQLNGVYRKKNKVTDVLSFPAYEGLREKRPLAISNISTLFLGDLAICHPQVKRQAREFSIGYWDEFIHLFFHGLFHLVGYDHETSIKEKKIMEALEENAIDLCSQKKSLSKTY